VAAIIKREPADQNAGLAGRLEHLEQWNTAKSVTSLPHFLRNAEAVPRTHKKSALAVVLSLAVCNQN
jgi:hypothetical protein